MLKQDFNRSNAEIAFTISSAISDSTALQLTEKPCYLLFFTKLPKHGFKAQNIM